jgi:hypothetical protein
LSSIDTLLCFTSKTVLLPWNYLCAAVFFSVWASGGEPEGKVCLEDGGQSFPSLEYLGDWENPLPSAAGLCTAVMVTGQEKHCSNPTIFLTQHFVRPHSNSRGPGPAACIWLLLWIIHVTLLAPQSSVI